MGLRNMNSWMMELSLHIVEDIVDTTMTAVSTGAQTPTVQSTDAMYVGAQIVINDTNPALVEVVTITAVNILGLTFTATFAFAHAANTQVLAATFPTQQPTDPLFTQTEVLGYLARAQNEFLAKLPLVFAFATQTVNTGAIYYPTPANAIELERVSVLNGLNGANIVSITRAGNTVTCTVDAAVSFYSGTKLTVAGVANSTFNGTFFLKTLSPDGLTLTWSQVAGNASSAGGTVGIPLLTRLYETTQEQVAMRDPQWFFDASNPVPQDWFEDRTGLYGWGVAPPPGSNFTVETLFSTRGPQTLGLLDVFVVPDLVAFYIKYKALEWMLRKAGEQRSPQMADYCKQRFDRGVMIIDRYLRNTTQAGG